MSDGGPAAQPADAPTGLARSLRRRHVEMIAIGGIIGAGLFVGSSSAIASIGPAAILSYAIAGLIVIAVMQMMAEMATSVRGAQAFPDFARAGLGDWAGFLSGWLYWYFWVVVVAIEAIAGAKIVHLWLPQVAEWQIGFALTTILTAINLLSTRSYGEAEFLLSSIKVAAIVLFIAAMVLALAGGLSFPSPGLANLAAHGGFMPHGAGSVVAGVGTVVFALVGAEIATVAAIESSEAETLAGRLTASVAIRILVFYVLSIALIVMVVPWTSVVPGTSPFAQALDVIGAPAGGLIMNVIVLIAVTSCLNSGLYVASRTLFILASHREAPRALGLTGRSRIPARAIVVSSLFSYAALAVSVVSPEGIFSFLVNASGATMLFIYLMIAFAQLRLRKHAEPDASRASAIRMWFHPWATIAAIAAMLAILFQMASSPTLASQFYASLVPAVVALAAFAIRNRSAGGAACGTP